MAHFNSENSFRDFVNEAKNKFRYIYSSGAKDFFSSFIRMAKNHKGDLTKDLILCRSQRGHAWRNIEQNGTNFSAEAPHRIDRMKPLKDKATEGRINPKGIPYIYLSNNKNTALAESRPWLEEKISLGYFKVKRKLNLVHFTFEESNEKIYFSSPPENEIDSIVWNQINNAFSTPIINEDDIADYVPTQILAEIIKKEGFDGVIYKSLLGKGVNIALFDMDSVELIKCSLFKTKSIEYNFKEICNPYHISNDNNG